MSRVRDLRVRPDLLYVASGWSTLVTDVHGRVAGDDPQGFYVDNTRVLSRERIVVNGREVTPFCTGTVGSHAQLSYAELGDGEEMPSRAAYLLVARFVGEGLRTRFTVQSYADTTLHLQLGLTLEADFVDQDDAERRERRVKADVVTEWSDSERRLLVTVLHPGLNRAVGMRLEAPGPVAFDDGTISTEVVVPPRGRASVTLRVEPVFEGRLRAAPEPTYDEPQDVAARARAQLTAELTRLRSTNLDVAHAWQTAVHDLTSLALGEPAGPAAPMAGLPIYQQVFGRDSLTVSWQALLAGPTMLRDSLRVNAEWVGKRIDDWRDEEPGKLLHQARRGPVSVLGIDPFTAYYGDWATPPDFLVFLGQYWAWTGDLETVRSLLPVARQVLARLDRYGDLDRDGFLDYHCRSDVGVKNQGWKDSDTAVVDEHGRVVDNPIAASELQGYWYAALRHVALAFAAAGDRVFAASLVRQASALRKRFHDAFWMPDHGCYALALGPDGRQVRSVNSNDGHLLASGIVPSGRARAVASRLMQPDMFSGWGIRTLSAEHAAYNPFSYHRGSVWPVESGTSGLGFARYGCWPELHRLAEGTFAAAALFEGHRLPEVLSGLPRDEQHPHPGIYPKSCSPQAWSASAIVTLVQALLALRPAAPLRTLLVDPHLPEWLDDLVLEGVQLGGTTLDLVVRRGRRGRTEISSRGGRVAVVRQPTLQARRVSASRGRRRGQRQTAGFAEGSAPEGASTGRQVRSMSTTGTG
jgi:glycogen debranching enzyme